jgi:hypothetical protein
MSVKQHQGNQLPAGNTAPDFACQIINSNNVQFKYKHPKIVSVNCPQTTLQPF